jgi:DNA-binding XRE family transcriptional regulator
MAGQPDPRPTHERFSGLLLQTRGRSGLTQRQLATLVGVNMRTIQGWDG